MSPDSTVDELLERMPPAAAVFVAHRMACVGCAMARFDTVGEAAAVYGITLAGFVDELQAHDRPPRKEGK